MVAWARVRDDIGHECQSCHATGTAGFIATVDELAMFGTIESNRYMMLEFFAVQLPPLEPMMVVNQPLLEHVASGAFDHPRFAVENAGMTALRAFHELTRQRCSPVE
jgi:hypothetical protein